MAGLIQVHHRETPGKELFEFVLSAPEQELILKEADGPPHVLEWVRRPKEGGVYLLSAEEMAELYEAIESVAYMYAKSAQTQAALQELVKKLEGMVLDYYREKYGVDGIINVGPGEEYKLEKYGLSAEELRASGGMKAAVQPGPNQPCPCGSGKKHKKCCGRVGA